MSTYHIIQDGRQMHEIMKIYNSVKPKEYEIKKNIFSHLGQWYPWFSWIEISLPYTQDVRQATRIYSRIIHLSLILAIISIKFRFKFIWGIIIGLLKYKMLIYHLLWYLNCVNTSNF